MDDPLAVSCLESPRNARRAPQRVSQGYRSSEETLLQRLAFDELENQKWCVVSLDEIEERADIGMVHLRDEPRLARVARETIDVVGECRWEHLDGHVASKARIARVIHLAHGASTQQRDNLIGPEPAARP